MAFIDMFIWFALFWTHIVCCSLRITSGKKQKKEKQWSNYTYTSRAPELTPHSIQSERSLSVNANDYGFVFI
jgi:hypothetical protein